MSRVSDLREHFSYDPETGIIRWKKHKFSNLPGRIAGCRTPYGYWLLSFYHTRILGHVAAWAIYYGKWPRFEIDHHDLDKGNNRIGNLRRANKSKNGANRPKQKNNTSGFKGVFWSKAAQKWMVQIRARGTLYYVGLFEDKNEAAAAYHAKAEELFGEFARAA